MSSDQAISLYDPTYKKHKYVFRFCTPNGSQYLFQCSGNDEAKEWTNKLNKAATFKTAGVRPRPNCIIPKGPCSLSPLPLSVVNSSEVLQPKSENGTPPSGSAILQSKSESGSPPPLPPPESEVIKGSHYELNDEPIDNEGRLQVIQTKLLEFRNSLTSLENQLKQELLLQKHYNVIQTSDTNTEFKLKKFIEINESVLRKTKIEYEKLRCYITFLELDSVTTAEI